MKKALAFAFAAVLITLCFTACGKTLAQSSQVEELVQSEQAIAQQIITKQINNEEYLIETFKDLQLSYNDTDESEWESTYDYFRANPYREITGKTAYLEDLQISFVGDTLMIPSAKTEIIYASNFTLDRDETFHICKRIVSVEKSIVVIRVDQKFTSMIYITG